MGPLISEESVENYIRFYNYKCRHSKIEYMTPHQKCNESKKWLQIFPIVSLPLQLVRKMKTAHKKYKNTSSIKTT